MDETPILTFGEDLRRERLIRDVSLEEISAATKISVRLLTALEKSDVAKLPAPVFTRGFIRAYSPPGSGSGRDGQRLPRGRRAGQGQGRAVPQGTDPLALSAWTP